MKSLRVILVLSLATLGSSSLLEMSQMLWSRLLSGGYRKVGQLDPLRVPVVKVDQSEGNTSYRVILRNLEVSGLNASTIESVHIERGRLKSNLSDSEAGYVSYNDQRDLDSIRYRFHTLVKEFKFNSEDEDEHANGRPEKVVEYDPMNVRVREEDDLLQPNGQSTQRYYASPVQQQGRNQTYQPIFGDMRVAMNATQRNPASLHLVYTHNYKNADSNPQPKDENFRPCIGACRHYQDSFGRVESRGYPSQQPQLSPNESARAQTRIYQDQRYNADRLGTESTTAGYAMKAQFEGSGFSAEASNGQRPNQFSFRRGNLGISYSDDSQNSRVPLESQSGDPIAQTYRGGSEPSERGNQHPVYFRGYVNQPTPANDKYSKQERDPVKYQAAPRNRFAESTTSSKTEEFEPYKAPMIRLEKQPGYVDIVYASEKKPENKPKFENLKEAPVDDPRTYGLAEIVKSVLYMQDLRENQRYIIHNFTEGESLRKRNDAVRVAAESKRIKDLIRYAKEYQEKQGYFEEGVELIYHFGNLKNGSVSNDTLTRRKRQHQDDKDEDDVMHVVVRIRVPTLSVKSNYALTGKVGKQVLRGNGLLTGNFTDLIADFTVELKKVNNNTMIVRAARAKLISKDRKIKLQGMDEKGPVEVILVHGLMAAEAVAAMVADDLASRALNEGNADAMIYKMYKNLPVVERI